MTVSPSPATNVRRERLAPPMLTAGLALGIIVTLALLFDPQSFLQRIKNSHMASVDIYFVKAIADGSHSMGLRLLLAKREIETGHYDSALGVLKPMLAAMAPASYKNRALWLYYSDLLAVTYTYPHGSSRRMQNERTLKLLISELRPYAHGTALRGLAHEAVVLHEGPAAISIYKDLATQNARQRAMFYRLAGAAALGLGHPREAAQLYFAAEHSAHRVSRQIANFLTALRILQSHGEITFAVHEARRNLGYLGADQAVLRYLIALARAANEPEVAAYYAKLLVRI